MSGNEDNTGSGALDDMLLHPRSLQEKTVREPNLQSNVEEWKSYYYLKMSQEIPHVPQPSSHIFGLHPAITLKNKIADYHNKLRNSFNSNLTVDDLHMHYQKITVLNAAWNTLSKTMGEETFSQTKTNNPLYTKGLFSKTERLIKATDEYFANEKKTPDSQAKPPTI